jgi:hypothetical protein
VDLSTAVVSVPKVGPGAPSAVKLAAPALVLGRNQTKTPAHGRGLCQTTIYEGRLKPERDAP